MGSSSETEQVPSLPFDGAAMFRLGASMLAPGGRRARLSVLIYHHVGREPDPLQLDIPLRETFLWQMQLLRSRFNVLPLREAVRRLEEGTLPARAVSVTFDDGYADNAENALPILRQLGVPATFFVCTGYLDGGRMWNDTVIEALRRARGDVLDLGALGLGVHPVGTEEERRRSVHALIRALKYDAADARERKAESIAEHVGESLPCDLMMRSDQVRELFDAGMEIGGHTVDHPMLSRVDPQRARHEIVHGKEVLEAITGHPVRLFAYPNGVPRRDYDVGHVAIVREAGFEGAFSTAWGVSVRGHDRFQLPRFTPWDRTPARFALRLLQNCLRVRPEVA